MPKPTMFSTWKMRLLDLRDLMPVPEAPPDQQDTMLSIPMLQDYVKECFECLEFFTSQANHNIIVVQLFMKQKERCLGIHRICAACQIFAFLLVRVDLRNTEARIKHIYDWLDPKTSKAVFTYALDIACLLVTPAGERSAHFLEYLRIIDEFCLEDNDFEYPVDLSVFTEVKLSMLNSKVAINKLINVIDIVENPTTNGKFKISNNFILALMLSADSDDMYPEIEATFRKEVICVKSKEMRSLLNHRMPAGYSCVFHES